MVRQPPHLFTTHEDGRGYHKATRGPIFCLKLNVGVLDRQHEEGLPECDSRCDFLQLVGLVCCRL